MNRRGFTLMELLCTVAILVVVVVGVGHLMQPMQTFFLRTNMNSQMNSSARTTLDTIAHALEAGSPGTVTICSCGGIACFNGSGVACTASTPEPPNSQIEFDLPGGSSHYVIYWATNTVNMTITGATTLGPMKLASNVAGLSFTGNSDDPAIVTVSLQMAAATNNAALIMPPQDVHMLGSQ